MKADGRKLHPGIRRCLTLALFCAAVIAIMPFGRAQTDYLMEVRSPSFAISETVEQGFVNAANGNLHLEIPLTSTPLRGRIPLKANLIYDSRIWKIVNNAWQPTNVPGSMGGWRFMTTADPGAVTYTTTRQTQGCSGQTYYEVYSPFYWRAPDGTQHVFPVSTQRDFGCGASSISTGSGFAEDSTGYKITINNYTQATVQSNDGSQVYPSVKDFNGNYYTLGPNGDLIDTLNRTVVTATVNGDLIYYDILNSQGSTSRYTVTTSTINVNTGFGVPGVTEYAGTVTVVQSIAVPDGTSFGFTYDSGYGLLQGMTLPTGGSIGYAFTTYQDSYGNMNRWLTSRTAGSGTWTYLPEVVTTCSPGTVGCQQKTTVTKPSGDRTAYIFTLNNDAWNVETDVYNGPSTLLKTVTTDYDFSNPCPACVGSIYVRPVRKTTVDVGIVPLTRKIEWTYDSPQYGNVTVIKEWGYYAGTPPATPDREIDFTYLNTSSYVNKNIISRVTNRSVKNGGGTKFFETAYGYDSTSLTLISGITHHDDPGYGTGNTVRGNPTLIRRWVSGSTYRSTTLYYDTTGQATKITNPKGNNTLFSYSDRFFADNGANPPQTYTPAGPTNAYVTQVTLPLTGSMFFGYYFNTGKIAD